MLDSLPIQDEERSLDRVPVDGQEVVPISERLLPLA